MTANRIDGRQLRLTSSHFVKHALRSGAGIFFVLVVVYFGMSEGRIVLTLLSRFQEMSAREGQTIEEQRNFLKGFFEDVELRQPLNTFFGSGPALTLESTDEEREKWQDADDWRAYLVSYNPAPWSVTVFLLIFTLPLLVVPGAFNQFSGDVQQKTLRYQLLRTNRANLFFGRFIGTALFCTGVLLLAFVIVTVFMASSLQLYEWKEYLPLFYRGMVAVLFLTPAYVALCQLVSTIVDSPFGSLLLSSAIVGIFPIIALGFFFVPATRFMINMLAVLPIAVQRDFTHPDASSVALAALACLLYTLVYLALGYAVFSRRDL